MAAGAGLEHHRRFGPAKALLAATAAAGLIVPLHLAQRAVAPHATPRLVRLFHRWLTRALGITVRMHGAPARASGVLYVANHLSWADIPVIGSQIPGCFVAKAEVGAMGPVGWFADLAGTIYIERARRHTAGVQRGALAERLAGGDNVILFPEGTTGNGVRLLPFKTPLFAAAEGVEDALIQPLSLAYTRINGLPVRRKNLADLAWIGEVDLGHHARSFVGLGRVRAELLLHSPVCPQDFPNRKALARHCEAVIAAGYARLMRG